LVKALVMLSARDDFYMRDVQNILSKFRGSAAIIALS
jgi:hypothetical protein